MLKFFLYLFLFYFILRFVLGRFLGGGVKTRVFRFETHHHHYKQPHDKEGTINVDPKTVKKNPNDRNIGEYVDYEEVK